MEFFVFAGAITFVVSLAILARNTACALVLAWFFSLVPSIDLIWGGQHRPTVDPSANHWASGITILIVIVAIVLDVIRIIRKHDDGKGLELLDPTL